MERRETLVRIRAHPWPASRSSPSPEIRPEMTGHTGPVRLPALHRGDCPGVPCRLRVDSGSRFTASGRARRGSWVSSLAAGLRFLPIPGRASLRRRTQAIHVSQLLAGDRSIPGRSPDTARTGADEAHRAGAAQTNASLRICPGTARRISARASRLLHQHSVTGWRPSTSKARRGHARFFEQGLLFSKNLSPRLQKRATLRRKFRIRRNRAPPR